MSRYVIQTSEDPEPLSVERLERAIDRLELRGDGVVRGISVDGSGGCLQVTIGVVGRPGCATREAERAFAQVWYDAFGERDARHLGRLVERGAALE